MNKSDSVFRAIVLLATYMLIHALELAVESCGPTSTA